MRGLNLSKQNSNQKEAKNTKPSHSHDLLDEIDLEQWDEMVKDIEGF